MSRTRVGVWILHGRAIVIVSVSVMLLWALAAPAGAHQGNTTHLWQDHIKPMGEPGTINNTDNPLHWTKLKGVPAGLADGTDNGVEIAGFGLTKTFTTFEVNTGQIQDRVGGACLPGSSIKIINQDGTVECNPGPRGFTKVIIHPGVIGNSMATVGSLALGKGTWAITARLVLNQADLDEETLIAWCELHAGGLIDGARIHVEGSNFPTAPLTLQLIATYSRSANASVLCRDNDVGNVKGENLSIIAIRLGSFDD